MAEEVKALAELACWPELGPQNPCKVGKKDRLSQSCALTSTDTARTYSRVHTGTHPIQPPYQQCHCLEREASLSFGSSSIIVKLPGGSQFIRSPQILSSPLLQQWPQEQDAFGIGIEPFEDKVSVAPESSESVTDVLRKRRKSYHTFPDKAPLHPLNFDVIYSIH